MRRDLLYSLILGALLAAAAGCSRSAASAGDGGPGGDAARGDCENLDLHDCRLRAECEADICFACSCAPSFEGCRRAGDPAFQCPILGCPQPPCCQDDSECVSMGGACAPPGTPFGCGMCNTDPGDCLGDTDCNTGDICNPILCSCIGESTCTAGCTGPSDCALGNECDMSDHPRCVPATCSASQPCPADFDCAGGACARRACTSDLECDGYCVTGACYPALGDCLLPVP